MKKYLSKIETTLSLVAIMLLCTACSKDSDTTPDSKTDPTTTPLTVNPTEIKLLSNAGSQASFTIACSGNWVAQCAESWLSLSSITGTNAGAIIVTAQTDNFNTVERSAIITVTCGSESKSVSVKQSPAETLELSGLDAPFDSSVGSIQTAYDLLITCSSSWKIESKPEWLDISALNGNGNQTIKVWANSTNESTQDRSGTIVVKSGSKTVSKVVTQRPEFSSCYARAKEHLTLIDSFVFGYDFSSNTTMVYFDLYSTNELNGITDKDLIYNLLNNQSEWTAKTPEQFGNYFSYTGAQPNHSYTLVSIAVSGNSIGEVNRKEFVTQKDDVYNSPFIANSNVSVGYETVNGQNSYRIKATKDTKYSAYADKFYSWAIAGINQSDRTLQYLIKDAYAILGYFIKNELSKNPSPHDTYINGTDRSVVRERLEGPFESANYTLVANVNNDTYFQIVNWCVLSNGEFSGKINGAYVNLTSNAAPLMLQNTKRESSGIKLVEFSPEKLKESVRFIKLSE